MKKIDGSAVQKVVIYARAGNEAGLDRQLNLLVALAKQKGWDVTKVYSDIAKGGVRKRPGLSRLLADARGGLVDVILVEDLSRLFRGRQFVPEIYFDLLTGKIGLVTPEGYLNADGNSHLLSLMVVFHEVMLEKHARRIAFAKELKKKREH